MKLVRMAVSHPHHNYNHPDISDSSAAICINEKRTE
jgi:hypothetical protein